jgi:alkylhydroperoxidase family enzyme
MSWVGTIPESQATGTLVHAYQRVRQRAGKLPNIARLQSLRPESMERGFDLYCQLMDSSGGISRRERVLIATVVSKINGCLY